MHDISFQATEKSLQKTEEYRYDKKNTLLSYIMAKRSYRLIALSGIPIAVIVVGALAFMQRHDIQRFIERSSLPSPIPYNPAVASSVAPTVSTKPSATPVKATPQPSQKPTGALPAEANLAVPFTVQAPYAIWDLPHEEFCEEASVLMAIRYVQHKPITGPADADKAMMEIKAFEETRFGYFKDTTAQETATILQEYFKYPNVKLVENPSVSQIKDALANNKPVIVPAAGRTLGNPYFQQPGPEYHMLVIKGYTKNGEFIVNDPGTRRGADFLYKEDVLMNAIHDWRPDGNVLEGRKVVIVVG